MVISFAYNFGKEIKGAYDDVQENKELLEGLVLYTDVISFSLDQVQRKKHIFVDTSVMEKSLQMSNCFGKCETYYTFNKMKNEIEAAKVLLKHSMLLINKTLGITDAMSHNMKLLVSPDNND